jgi:hypothetical protein
MRRALYRFSKSIATDFIKEIVEDQNTNYSQKVTNSITIIPSHLEMLILFKEMNNVFVFVIEG